MQIKHKAGNKIPDTDNLLLRLCLMNELLRKVPGKKISLARIRSVIDALQLKIGL